jgi:hypothetical protein
MAEGDDAPDLTTKRPTNSVIPAATMIRKSSFIAGSFNAMLH